MARKIKSRRKKPENPPTAVISIRILWDAKLTLEERAAKRGIPLRQVMREILEAAA